MGCRLHFPSRRPRESPVRPSDDLEPSQLRRVAKPVFIGLVGLVGLGVSIAIPILLVIILAIVAQLIISGH